MSDAVTPTNKETTKMFRQGDVLIVPTDSVPREATRETPEAGRFILMHGEATGHAHAVLERDAEIRSRTSGMTVERWLSVHAPTTVFHEEHAPIPLAPGNYKILRQRVYAPEGIKNVQD